MRRKFNNLISVCFTCVRFIVIKLFYLKTFKFHLIERISPNVVIELNRGGNMKLGKMVRIHSGSKVKVRSHGKLCIEDNVKINYNCIIACQHSICIGENTQFGPSVYLYDHDHDYIAGLEKDKYKTGSIKIGKNCWIGANTVILKDTVIGDNCVIGAGSVIKGKFEDNSVIIQKRNTEILRAKI